MAASKSRKRSPHPGVVLLKPSGRRLSWRARFEDPDTGKLTFESLDAMALRNDTARRDWAIRKAKANAQRRLELEGGAARLTGTPLADGLASYFDKHTALRERTLQDYRSCVAEFQTWAAGAGIETLDQITRPKLIEFRTATINAPHTTAKGKTARSKFTVNRILRGNAIVLRWLFDIGKLPKCSSDDLRSGLKREKAEPTPTFLDQRGVAALMRVCMEHDRSTYRETRAEHRGEGTPGSTPRYELVSPFVLTLLLCGLRFSEALNLTWKRVDLDAPGDDGFPAGSLFFGAADTKTKKKRHVYLDVCPVMRRLLQTLRKVRPNDTRVFEWLDRPLLEAARKRLKSAGAPDFAWQELRATCGTFMTNARGVFGSASAFSSAKQLGHSVAIAEAHYVGKLKGILPHAATVESAMAIESEAEQVVELVRERFGGRDE